MTKDLLTLYYRWSMAINNSYFDELTEKQLNKILNAYKEYINFGGKRRNRYLDSLIEKVG